MKIKVRMYQSDPFAWFLGDEDEDWYSLYEIDAADYEELAGIQAAWRNIQSRLKPAAIEEDE